MGPGTRHHALPNALPTQATPITTAPAVHAHVAVLKSLRPTVTVYPFLALPHSGHLAPLASPARE